MKNWKQHTQPKQENMASSPPQRMSILIVDDEENILYTLKKLFEHRYKVMTTTSAKEALEIFKREQPAIIIADQRMPEIDGITLLGKIHEIDRDCIKIMITGFDDLGILIDALRKRMLFSYLRKPWDTEELTVIVNQGADTYYAIKENERLQQTIQTILEERKQSEKRQCQK